MSIDIHLNAKSIREESDGTFVGNVICCQNDQCVPITVKAASKVKKGSLLPCLEKFNNVWLGSDRSERGEYSKKTAGK